MTTARSGCLIHAYSRLNGSNNMETFTCNFIKSQNMLNKIRDEFS